PLALPRGRWRNRELLPESRVMHLQVLREGGLTRVILDGRLDVAGVQQGQDQFTIGVNTALRSAVVDCSQLAFIASLGIGMLVTAAKGLRRKGRTMILLRPQPMIEETLRMAGIHNIIPILHEEEGPQGARG